METGEVPNRGVGRLEAFWSSGTGQKAKRSLPLEGGRHGLV
jgi:hypothetical protein